MLQVGSCSHTVHDIHCCLARASDWDRIQVRYETLPGWETVTADVRSFDQLPENCRKYIKFISDFIKVPVRFIGVGPAREALIVVR